MPTVLRVDGYRFFFYSNENSEPPHIHVEKGSAEAKLWLEPVFAPVYFEGFNSREENEIIKIAREELPVFIKKWYEYFRK